MIVVTGANGRLGRRVVERLLTRVPAADVAVSVRDRAAAADLAARGVAVREGDFDDPASLRAAFAGAEQVLVVSANAVGDVALRRHRAAFEAAADAGAQRILYTSHMGADPGSAFPPMVSHAASEALLAELGVPHTALRNGFYASTVPMLAERARETGTLAAPADGPVSWTTHDDLAEAAAIVLTEPGRFEGPTPPLTAPAAFDLDDVAGWLSMERVVTSDAEHHATLVAAGVPPERADILVGMFQASRRGEFARTDPALAELLGREPQTLRDVLVPATRRRART
ncbi:MAG TPA: NAD(P)H-binding protein [Capillimicrobium sp.]|nr:NAD(P)H-binding protein [Capillimicrobium sp.]